jgi:hypothetical protein
MENFKVAILWLHLPAETRKCNPKFNQGSPADNRVRNPANRKHVTKTMFCVAVSCVGSNARLSHSAAAVGCDGRYCGWSLCPHIFI